jgi:hypothetical protein
MHIAKQRQKSKGNQKKPVESSKSSVSSWSSSSEETTSGEAEAPMSKFDKAFKKSSAKNNFLKSLDNIGEKRERVEVVTYELEENSEGAFCVCGEGEYGDMIQCDGKHCLSP